MPSEEDGPARLARRWLDQRPWDWLLAAAAEARRMRAAWCTSWVCGSGWLGLGQGWEMVGGCNEKSGPATKHDEMDVANTAFWLPNGGEMCPKESLDGSARDGSVLCRAVRCRATQQGRPPTFPSN
jgi:hypothetical protein